MSLWGAIDLRGTREGFREVGDLRSTGWGGDTMTPFMVGEIRAKALAHAIDYHALTWGPAGKPSGPNPEEIIATAAKFAGFLLVEKKSIQPRGRRS